jgi:predicted DNA-binding ribbon-helix-helix protein
MAGMDRQSEERRCMQLDGGKACVSLASGFWDSIEQIATQRGTTLERLVAQVVGDANKDEMSTMLRVYVLAYYQQDFGYPLLNVSDLAQAEVALPLGMSTKRHLH